MDVQASNNKITFEENDYYHYTKILSYNKLFNFVIGARGVGKTFGAKKIVINNFLKTGQQFIYVRRYFSEHDAIKTFFDDIRPYYPGHTLQVKHQAFYIDNKVAGWYLALNTAGGKKSVSYANVSTIIFDEFIIESGGRGYLKSEVNIFLSLYETIARTRSVKVLFLSNSVSQVNPYFVFWNIHLIHGQKFWNNNKQIVVERCSSDSFRRKKNDTPFGQLIAGTQVGDYMIDNIWLDDSDTFIEQMTGDCKPICEIAYMNNKYYVWERNSNDLVYFTNKSRTPMGTSKIALTTNDHDIDYTFVKSPSSSSLLSSLLEIYRLGKMRFNSIVAKQAFLDIMQLI